MSLYSKLLKTGEKALKEIQVPFKVRTAAAKLQVTVIELESEIADLELSLTQSKSADPLDFQSILKALTKLELKQRELKIAKDLQLELFGK